jgi:hypothetical protein
MKNLLTAILLLSSVGAHGQSMTYLKCEPPPTALGALSRILVLNDELFRWSFFWLIEQQLEENLTDEIIENQRKVIDGSQLDREITQISSSKYLLNTKSVNNPGSRFTVSYRLDRLTGELFYSNDEENDLLSTCLPLSRSEAEVIVQEIVDRRDAIIADNEERRLF